MVSRKRKMRIKNIEKGLLPNVSGFTMVEILIVISTISLLAANIAVPNYLKQIDTARKNVCYKNMRTVEYSDANYTMDLGKFPAALKDLAREGYLDAVPECPAGGVYAWGNDHSSLICSVHGIIGGAVTELGDTPLSIASNFIKLLKDFYNKNGKYPEGSWKKVMKQIGADPGEWKKGVDGVIYRASSKSVRMTVDKGYTFKVNNISGKELTLGKGQTLIYSVNKDQWYCKKIKKGNEIDINTFEVKKD